LNRAIHGPSSAESGKTFSGEYRDAIELFLLAEALGLDSAWASEHHGSSDGYLPSLLAWGEGQDTPDRDLLEPPTQDEASIASSVTTGSAAKVLRELRSIIKAYRERSHFELVVWLACPGMTLDDSARRLELFGERVLPALNGA
jgi:hypothetical protein